MKLLSFEVSTPTGANRRLGARNNGEIIDLTMAYATKLAETGLTKPIERTSVTLPTDMMEFLRGGAESMEAAREAIDYARSTERDRGPGNARFRYEPDEVSLLSPLPRPNSIRDFSAFEQHVKNGFASYDLDVPDEWYEIPASYKGDPDSVINPGSVVEWPPFTEKLDYELELAAVVGKRGRDVSADEAEEYIAGYTIFNDFSARDIQATEMAVRFGPGKGKDFANGFGPYLVTPDEFDVADARMVARVNGETWSEGNTGEMYHTFGDMIEYLTWGGEIHPGDVLGSGTIPFGCGKGLDRWVRPGDIVELEIDGLGVLRHTIGNPG